MKSSLDYYDGRSMLLFSCEPEVRLTALNLEPNGYFWDSVSLYVASELSSLLDFDSEADMFCVNGEREHLEQLQALLEPFFQDPELTVALAQEAQASGFIFDC